MNELTSGELQLFLQTIGAFLQVLTWIVGTLLAVATLLYIGLCWRELNRWLS